MLIPFVIVLLISVNALYVAAEFAAVSVRRSRIRQMATEGNALARSVFPIIDSPRRLDRYIAACQVGITFSSLVLGAYGQATIPDRIAPAFESLGGFQEATAQGVSAIVVLLGLTGVQVVLGELVPKSVALQFPTQTVLLTSVPMRWSLRVLRPFIALLNGSGLALLRLVRAGAASHGHVHSPDEIELLIVQSSDGGLLSRDERRRLRRALQLGARAAHEVMVPRTSIVGIEVSTPLDAVNRIVAESPYTRLPVYVESIDNIVGVLHTRDLVLAQMHADGEQPQLEALARPVVMLPETISVDRLLAALRAEHSPMAVVVDEYGGVAGLVTLEDVLAEIFGEIGDEFKATGPAPAVLPDGRLRLPGIMPADDVEQWLRVRVAGRSDTLGGRVTEMLGHLPQVGERVTVDGAELEVEAVNRRAVTWLIGVPASSGGEES